MADGSVTPECCMCGTTTAKVYWTIVVPQLKSKPERQVCNGCELEYRRGRRQ